MVERISVATVACFLMFSSTCDNQTRSAVMASGALNEPRQVVKQIEEVQEEPKAELKVEVKAEVIEEVKVKPIKLNVKDISVASNVTIDEMEKVLEGTGMADIATTLVEVEQEIGVNALILSAIIALESGWGTSRRATVDNNLAGLAVYNNKSKGVMFNSRGESVKYLGKLLKDEYITKGGRFYVGGKSLDKVSRKYCPPTHSQWARDVTSISRRLYNKAVEHRRDINGKK